MNTSRTDVDAVVIGAGINGMVAAAELAIAGWRVVLLESGDRIGGFIGSGELVEPGFVHDTFSSWHPLFVAGGAYARLRSRLEEAGLTYCNVDGAVTASVSERGTAIAYRDPGITAGRLSVGSDRQAYRTMMDEFGAQAPHIFRVLGSELNNPTLARIGLNALRRLGLKGAVGLGRGAVQSGRAYVRERFDGWEIDQLWVPWLLHAGLSPDHASGGLMLPVMAATMHGFGLPVVAGGSSEFVSAFATVLEKAGVSIRTGERAEEVMVEHGRAVGVRTGAAIYRARRAVLASVAPEQLYGDLLAKADIDPSTRVGAKRFRAGRGAMQVHLTLDAPVPWSNVELSTVPLIHVSNGADSTGVACAQAEADLLPNAPTVVVGQQAMLDPSRAPDGKATLWLQLQEVPYAPAGDAGGTLDVAGGWTDDLREGFVSRVIDRIADHAPGFRALIRGQAVLSPADLEAHNPNALRGDPYAGSAELDQNLLWRPLPQRGTHLTAIPGLWHIGASTHPGPGLGGGSGHLVASRLAGVRP